MGNCKSGLPIRSCPRCGMAMDFGERVKVAMSWEYGGSYRRVVSFRGIICRACAEQVSNFTRIDRPEVGSI